MWIKVWTVVSISRMPTTVIALLAHKTKREEVLSITISKLVAQHWTQALRIFHLLINRNKEVLHQQTIPKISWLRVLKSEMDVESQVYRVVTPLSHSKNPTRSHIDRRTTTACIIKCHRMRRPYTNPSHTTTKVRSQGTARLMNYCQQAF